MIAYASRLIAALMTVILLAGVAGCAGTPPVDGSHAGKPVPASRHAPTAGDRAVAVALEQVGVPYRYGGASPAGFDCSGLVQYSYRAAGRHVPRTTGGLWKHAETVTPDRLRAGDLLFFKFDGKMSHVGLYVGNGRFVHAPSTGRTVAVDVLWSEPYGDALLRAGRLP